MLKYNNQSSNDSDEVLSELKIKTNIELKNKVILEQENEMENDNYFKLQFFESGIPEDISNEKKMSLLIIVLLQTLFQKSNINSKLEKIYDYLVKSNILDESVREPKYNGIINNLTAMIQSINNKSVNILNPNVKNIISNENFYSEYNKSDILDKLELGNYYESNSVQNIFTSANIYRTNFNQIKLLGQGSYGTVYKVFHKFEKKFYAIKKIFITKEIIQDNYDIFREIQVYSNLEHDNIVRYYGSWVAIDLESIEEYNNSISRLISNDVSDYDEIKKIDYVCPILFIQMELCDFTLREYLMTYSTSDSIFDKINIFSQIVNGLEYLEQKNIIHRDIKPDNIFISSNKNNSMDLIMTQDKNFKYKPKYTIKLGDFGLCKKYMKNDISSDNIHKKILIESDCTFNNNDLSNDIVFEQESNSNNNSESIKSNQSIIDSIFSFAYTSDFDEHLSKNNSNALEIMCSNNELSKMSSCIGTGIYRVPEISNGNYDQKIDVYSIGIILLELIINFTTYSEKIYTVRKILGKNYELLEKNDICELSHNDSILVKNIIYKCIEKVPSKRLSLKEVRAQLNLLNFNFI